MSKQIKAKVRLQLPAGAANPAPPVGSTLGPHGINLMKFCTDFNNVTKEKKGEIVPIIVTVFVDKSYEIEYKTSSVSQLIKKLGGFKKGSEKVGSKVVGSITEKDVEEIAKIKMVDLNTSNLEAAKSMIRGSARSMGCEIV
jgi:large subunit ribosomal protein L11